ncbi:competence protein CoiA [Apilactobacillus xinyiensis]|uniref:competence protein CoiA n=1 Tax=Apilactobacillus xinyiensis TaxID=2841032 RepID=UPI00200E64AD|nr:competence protein CoiA family protein [Apilactobacillus xinyiensis]MCL0329876.1 hypothetical protein [Apilactobacillus xinyiensis]
MITAIDNNGKFVVASKNLMSKNYHCISCKACVFLKSGNINSAHFAHYSKSKCNIIEMENESSEHIMGKLGILKFISEKNGILEYYLPTIKQRPDIMFDCNVIEFQCSPISNQRLIERNNGYNKLKLNPCWILGSNYYKNRFQNSTKKFYSYCRNLGFYVLFWNVGNSQLILNYQINAVDGKIISKEKRFIKFNHYIMFKNKNKLNSINLNNSLVGSLKRMEKQLLYKNLSYQHMQDVCYKNGFNLLTCSLDFYIPRVTIPVYKVNPVFVRIHILNVLDNSSKLFIIEYVISQFVWQSLVPSNIIKQFISKLVDNYLEFLINRGYVSKLNEHYILNTIPKEFPNFYEKINKAYKL